jgi:hypothetical protein
MDLRAYDGRVIVLSFKSRWFSNGFLNQLHKTRIGRSVPLRETQLAALSSLFAPFSAGCFRAIQLT